MTEQCLKLYGIDKSYEGKAKPEIIFNRGDQILKNIYASANLKNIYDLETWFAINYNGRISFGIVDTTLIFPDEKTKIAFKLAWV